MRPKRYNQGLVHETQGTSWCLSHQAEEGCEINLQGSQQAIDESAERCTRLVKQLGRSCHPREGKESPGSSAIRYLVRGLFPRNQRLYERVDRFLRNATRNRNR